MATNHLANTTDTTALQAAINEVVRTGRAALDRSLRVVENVLRVRIHNYDTGSHPDIRAVLQLTRNNYFTVSGDMTIANADLLDLTLRVTAIEPTWYPDDTYTGMIEMNDISTESNFGLIITPEDEE